jgi:glucokinase
MAILAGVDIGGTKCAVCLGEAASDTVSILAKTRFLTPAAPTRALEQIIANLKELVRKEGVQPQAVGIVCGGPLDSHKGLVMSPPNLPGWDQIDVVSPLAEALNVPAGLQNDANAGALAEWHWGAGKGSRNMVFLTFGTGMGAGLILDGKLYQGTNGLAGEVGHIRLENDGPIGYGKAGSFEGFCSGGGIARMAQSAAEAAIRAGHPPSFCANLQELPLMTAEKVAYAARDGDALALDIYSTTARQLGKGLALLVDILNPEVIVIGSIYGRQQALLQSGLMSALREEALPEALEVCRIVPAGLGESIGDLAGLSTALELL